MKPLFLSARRIGVLMFSLCAVGLMTSVSMPEEAKFVVEPVVETKVTELPPGPLFWRLENFPTLKQAQIQSGSDTEFDPLRLSGLHGLANYVRLRLYFPSS